MKLDFSNIDVNASVQYETPLYIHYYFPLVKDQYDSNYILFKIMPTLEELTAAMEYLKKFHQSNGQPHMKFVFPENEQPPTYITHYLQKLNYETGCLEMYAISPSSFSYKVRECIADISFVNESTLDAYLQLQYDDCLVWGKEYADAKQLVLIKDFRTKRTKPVIATIDGKLVGATELIEKDTTIEIDNLFVLEPYRKQGIGSQLQQFVMDYAKEKYVILLADKEDTPRLMYQKQGYQKIGFRCNALHSEGAMS